MRGFPARGRDGAEPATGKHLERLDPALRRREGDADARQGPGAAEADDEHLLRVIVPEDEAWVEMLDISGKLTFFPLIKGCYFPILTTLVH